MSPPITPVSPDIVIMKGEPTYNALEDTEMVSTLFAVFPAVPLGVSSKSFVPTAPAAPTAAGRVSYTSSVIFVVVVAARSTAQK